MYFWNMMKWTTAMILAFLGLTLTPLSAQDKPITEEELALQRALIEANKFFLLEDYEKATAAYSELIHQDQDNSAAIYGLSRIHFRQKDFKEANRLASLAIKNEPDNIYYYEHQVKVLNYLKDYAAQAEAYVKMIELDPENEGYKIELSNCYERQKEYKSAMDVLEDLNSHESDPAIALRKARIYSKMGKDKKAVSIYEDMIELHPGETRYMHVLANHYRTQGDQDAAIGMYKKILKVDPEDSRAGLAIANHERNKGSDLTYLESIRKIISSPSISVEIKVKELIPFVQKLTVARNEDLLAQLMEYSEILIGLHPDEAAVYALAADLYNINQDTDAALESFRRSLELEKGVYTVWEQYLFLLSEKNDHATMLEVGEEALEYFPNRGRINMLYGLALYENERSREAVPVLQTALMMSGRDVILKFEINALLGKVLYDTGDYDGSDRAFDSALEINGDHRDLLASYAYHLALQDRRLEDALEMAERAYRMSDNTASANLAYAWVLSRKGDHEKALQIIESGLSKTNQSSAEYLERYGDILFLNGREAEAVTQWKQAKRHSSQKERIQEKIDKRALK